MGWKAIAMRIVIDIMIGLMVVAVLATGVYLYNSRAQGEQTVQAVRSSLARLEQQAAYHTTVQSAMAGRDVLLVHIDQRWFGEDVPTNPLLDANRPWIDLAPPGDVGQHPPDPVIYDEHQASFWYNPTTGTFRARVAPAASEAATLTLYNQVNTTALTGFAEIPDTSRQPIAHTPGKTPARQYASMANKTWSETPDEREELATDLIEAEARSKAPAEHADATTGQDDRATADRHSTRPELAQDAATNPQSQTDAQPEPDARPTLRRLKND